MPKKLTITYHAPKDDSRVVEIWGHTFFDNKPEHVTISDAAYLEASNHKFFECSKPTDVAEHEAEPEPEKETRGVGRPRK